MKIIMICFIAYLIYDYIRDRKNEKKLAEVKARYEKKVMQSEMCGGE